MVSHDEIPFETLQPFVEPPYTAGESIAPRDRCKTSGSAKRWSHRGNTQRKFPPHARFLRGPGNAFLIVRFQDARCWTVWIDRKSRGAFFFQAKVILNFANIRSAHQGDRSGLVDIDIVFVSNTKSIVSFRPSYQPKRIWKRI